MATQKLAEIATTATAANHQTRSFAAHATIPSRVAADAWSGTSHSRRHTASSRMSPAEMPIAIVSRAGQPPSSDPTNALEISAYATRAEGEVYQRSRGRFRGQGSVDCRWATRSVI
jgi:hypothetical protein